MALSTSSAIKAYLEAPAAMGGGAIGVSVYRDQAPARTPPPYVTVSEAIGIVFDGLEDGVAGTVREHVTVDIWMAWKNITGSVVGGVVPGGLVESYTLPTVVARALEGSRLLPSGSGAPPAIVYGTLINSMGPRIVDQDENIIHVPIWIEVWRRL